MITGVKISKEAILRALNEVKDPEIPTVSLVELGVVTDVTMIDDNSVSIHLTPTFSGCPALKVMEELVREKIEMLGVKNVEVKTSFDVQWNTDMITESGREALKKHGLTPPPKLDGLVQIELLEDAACPFCGSKNTELKTPFGSTLCRSIHYCNNCRQSFEQFKPVS